MFQFDLKQLIIKKGEKTYYRVPVLELMFEPFWAKNQKFLDPKHEVVVNHEKTEVYALVRTDQVKTARIIAASCGDPRKIYA